MISLKNKKVLVTGASSGIGKSIAIQLSQLGAKLIITGRNELRLSETLILCEEGGHTALIADMTVESDINQLVKNIEEIDGAVFCAGIISYIPIKFLSNDKINDIFDVNFKCQVILTQKLLKQKKINKQGSLVYISSLSSKLGVAGTSVYAASKSALSAFVRVLATEVAGQKIRANTVSPGIIRTPLFTNSETSIADEDFDNKENAYPLGYGNAEDVAAYVAFLLSDNSTWITGSDLVMDGGFTLS
ncbi:SDR family oxidoreductase [Mucilaginibacter sp. dw_454]|uniref:SDR family NAD(P)-dependent oxidoreductase n=1 Tax=Mucilaginibacter sp. dw_454 TaxID=2720079 RepID=UPI001BD21B0A|nr:SDR family oxidoreductase [Mucilaginibacter sp. dw_454]